MLDRRSIASRIPRSRRTQALDAWLGSAQRIEDACIELRKALDALEPSILDWADAIAGGESMTDIVGRTRLRARRQMTEALGAMTSALARNRVAAIRILVDDENLSMTEAARLFGIPRQVLSRLYHGEE